MIHADRSIGTLSLVKVIGQLILLLLILSQTYQSMNVTGMVIPEKRMNSSKRTRVPSQTPQQWHQHQEEGAIKDPFEISPDTQAKIYNLLDSNKLKVDQISTDKTNNKGLFSTKEDSENESLSSEDFNSNEEFTADEKNENFQMTLLSNGGQDLPRNASVTTTSSRAPSLLDILTLTYNYEQEEKDRRKLNNNKYRSDEDQTRSMVIHSVNESSLWEWSQVRRKRVGNKIGFLIKPRRREKRNVGAKWIDSMCLKVPRVDNFADPPLRCYECESTMNDKDPQCDAKLFKFLRHSQKFNLRSRCSRDNGDFCIKKVKRKFGERVTERGCFRGPILGPKGQQINSKDPCFTHSKDGYLTTTCFCSNNLCNAAPALGPGGVGSLFSIIVIFIALVMYGLVFAFAERGIGNM